MLLHPIVAQLAPSTEQVPAIVSRGTDVVVTAGAGAGKTQTLVARYLSLLSEGIPLRSIVAITFTRKAAREMRNRIRHEIDRYLGSEELGQEDRAHWLRLYAELDAARIGTIHSLCAEMLRGHPAELGLDPRFTVIEEGQANILRGQALDEALRWAANQEDAVALYALLGERQLRATLDTLTRSRLETDDAFAAVQDDVLDRWRRALHRRQKQALLRLRRQPAWRDALDTLREARADDPNDRLETQRVEALGAAEVPEQPLRACLDSLSGLDGINLTGGRAKAWPGGKDTVGEIKEALRTLRDLWHKSSPLLNLELNALDEDLAVATPLLRKLYLHAVLRYQAFKDQRHALDYDDLEEGSLSLLSRNRAARHRWRREIRAILVDEFQDTNARQRDLVSMLNGQDGKLFVVGDAKQSIYAFRGADVTVFRELRRDIVEEGGESYALDTTYRAHRELVGALNALLRPVLGEEEDPARPWAEPFAPLLPYRDTPRPGYRTPFVEIHLALGTKSSGAMELAADALADRLVTLVGGAKGVGYGDVAVLCRASTSFAAYEDAFERAELPFLTVAGRGFYGRPEIRDLLNILTALADPTDDLALVGALRSPVLGLSDAAIYRIRSQQLRTTPDASLWQALTSGDVEAPTDEADRLHHAVRAIEALHQQVGKTAVADLLAELLVVTDYRAALIQAGQTRASRNVAKLLSDAQASGIISVGGFVEYIAELRDSGARESEARSISEGAIQIMSVHAAKGLEFPVVVIGEATYTSRPPASILLDPELGMLLPLGDEDTAPASYKMGRLLAEDKEDAEEARLFYVAATRASEVLILSGCVKSARSGKLSIGRSWLGRIGGPECLSLGTIQCDTTESSGRAITHELTLQGAPVSCTLYEAGWVSERSPRLRAPVKPALVPPGSPPLLNPIPAEGYPDKKDTPDRVWRVVPPGGRRYAPGWVIGKLVHQALAAWRYPDNGFEAWSEAQARGMGIIDQEQLRHAVSRSRELLLRFWQHPLSKEIEGSERRYHEVPYSITVDGRTDGGTIDLLYRWDDAWTIVEFKTDRVKTRGKLTELLDREDYVAQVERYAKAVESLLGHRPTVKLCLLDYAGGILVLNPLE